MNAPDPEETAQAYCLSQLAGMRAQAAMSANRVGWWSGYAAAVIGVLAREITPKVAALVVTTTLSVLFDIAKNEARIQIVEDHDYDIDDQDYPSYLLPDDRDE